jgi:hypothetical protein
MLVDYKIQAYFVCSAVIRKVKWISSQMRMEYSSLESKNKTQFSPHFFEETKKKSKINFHSFP